MNFKRQNKETVEVNLTPLIDVVFLLLIFFMVSTTFTKENQRRAATGSDQSIRDHYYGFRQLFDQR